MVGAGGEFNMFQINSEISLYFILFQYVSYKVSSGFPLHKKHTKG